ncbi:hypothetical protein, partial [Streptomyces griseolus]|uniref:hypothetical protein n=1 Tax=Streptomyces griseolus TaxID=1909 RepID=UPI00055A60D9
MRGRPARRELRDEFQVGPRTGMPCGSIAALMSDPVGAAAVLPSASLPGCGGGLLAVRGYGRSGRGLG